MTTALAFMAAGTLLSPFFLDWYAPGYYRLYPNDIISLGNKTAVAPLSSFEHVVDVAAELQHVHFPTVDVVYVTVTTAKVLPAVVAPKVVEIDRVPEHAVASASLSSTSRFFGFLFTVLQSPLFFLAMVLYDVLLLAFSVHDFLRATISSLVENVLARQIGQYYFLNLVCVQVRDHADAVVCWFCLAAASLLKILITKVSPLVKNLFREVGEHHVALVSLNARVDKVNKSIDEIDDRLNQTNLRDVTTDSCINGLQGSVSSLTTLVGTIQRSLNDAVNRIATLFISHKDLSANHTTLRGDHDELSGMHTALSSDHDSLLARHNTLSTDHAVFAGSHNALYGIVTDLSKTHDVLNKLHADNIKEIRKQWNQHTFQTTKRFKDESARVKKAEAKITALETALNQLRIERTHDREDFTNLLNLVEMSRVAMVVLPGHSRPAPVTLVARHAVTAATATTATATATAAAAAAATATAPNTCTIAVLYIGHRSAATRTTRVAPTATSAASGGGTAPNPFFWGAPGTGSSTTPPFNSTSFVPPTSFDFGSATTGTSAPFRFSGNSSSAPPAGSSTGFTFGAETWGPRPPLDAGTSTATPALASRASSSFIFGAETSSATPPPGLGSSGSFNFTLASGPTP